MEKTKKRQLLMRVLRDAEGRCYYDGAIDGKDGPKTREGARRFLEDYGFAEPEADTGKHDFWEEIEFFSRKEFKCKCGGRYCDGFPAEPSETTARYADEIRRRLGVPLGVNSGLRCQEWNRLRGGVANSQHLTGGAVDLGCPAGVTPERMASVAEEVMGGTGGIGIYDWGIHIDNRSVKARWDYRGK